MWNLWKVHESSETVKYCLSQITYLVGTLSRIAYYRWPANHFALDHEHLLTILHIFERSAPLSYSKTHVIHDFHSAHIFSMKKVDDSSAPLLHNCHSRGASFEWHKDSSYPDWLSYFMASSVPLGKFEDIASNHPCWLLLSSLTVRRARRHWSGQSASKHCRCDVPFLSARWRNMVGLWWFS